MYTPSTIFLAETDMSHISDLGAGNRQSCCACNYLYDGRDLFDARLHNSCLSSGFVYLLYASKPIGRLCRHCKLLDVQCRTKEFLPRPLATGFRTSEGAIISASLCPLSPVYRLTSRTL